LDDLPFDLAAQAQERKRLVGVYPAVVQSITDPDQQGRVRVRLPWAPDGSGAGFEAWARLATLMAGRNRGTWFIPDVDDEVLVMFEAGDPRRPYVVGALWNGQDTPPETMDSAGNNAKKSIRSRNGVKVTLDDTNGQESLTLETPGGQKITLKDGPGSVEIQDSNGNDIKLEAAGITIRAAAKLTVQAMTVEVNASLVNVNAAMSKFSGVVKADTVITNAVVSASYSPGAGNIW
jgi:uncharacterized protein involved in type VI secretion and phage assembly